MRNDIGPDYVVLNYTGNGHQHTMSFSYDSNITPTPGVEPNATKNGGGTIALTAAVNAYVDVLKAAFNPADSFVSYTAYHKSSPGSIPVWIYADNVTTGAGTGGSDAAVANSEMTVSFRTRGGGRFRVQLMEAHFGVNWVYEGAGFEGNAFLAALRDYLVSEDGWVTARDGHAPMVAIRAITKTNDALRRHYAL